MTFKQLFIMTTLIYTLAALSLYTIIAFVTWDLPVIPAVWNWTNEQRLVFLGAYVCCMPFALPVVEHINTKAKEDVESFTNELWNKDKL